MNSSDILDDKVYILNQEEQKIIDKHRQRIVDIQESLEKRKTCLHNWIYDGHSHNDDCYECTICGESEYR